jgi:hypothetical protein
MQSGNNTRAERCLIAIAEMKYRTPERGIA